METAGGVSSGWRAAAEDMNMNNTNTNTEEKQSTSPLSSVVSADLVLQSPELFQVPRAGAGMNANNMHSTAAAGSTRSRVPFIVVTGGGALRPRRNSNKNKNKNNNLLQAAAVVPASITTVFRTCMERPIVRMTVFTSLLAVGGVTILLMMMTIFSKFSFSSLWADILMLFGSSSGGGGGVGTNVNTVPTIAAAAAAASSALPIKASSKAASSSSSAAAAAAAVPSVVAAEVPTPISLVNTIAPVPIAEAIEGTSDATFMSAGVSFLVLTAARLGLRQ